MGLWGKLSGRIRIQTSVCHSLSSDQRCVSKGRGGKYEGCLRKGALWGDQDGRHGGAVAWVMLALTLGAHRYGVAKMGFNP